MTVLQLSHVSKEFRRPVLRSIDVEIPEGTVTAVTGPNGSGSQFSSG